MMLPKHNPVAKSNSSEYLQAISGTCGADDIWRTFPSRSHRLSALSFRSANNWDVHAKGPPPSLCLQG